MIHSLLRKHWRHCCRTEHCIAEFMQLFRGFKSRGHCPAELRLLFKEVSEKLANKHEIEEVVGNKTVSLKLNLNLQGQKIQRMRDK